MKRFVTSFKEHWEIVFLLLLSGLIIWPLFVRGYFTHHDDLQIIRIYEMRKCLADFQIPCRWVPDMGYGNGYPLFNYYAPFPYYIGAILSFVFGYIGSAKILFLIPLVFGGVSMHFLARELTNRWGGFLAGILYMFAPYRALDTYVRGAVTESWAVAVIPLVFYFLTKLLKEGKKKYFTYLFFSLSAFLLSHNIMIIFFFPILIAWLILFGWENKKNIRKAVTGILLGIGFSSFFLFPAFLEKELVQSESLTRFELDYHANFVAVRQLFERSWGYGASVLGTEDQLSFQLGYPHILLLFIVPLVLIILIRRKRYSSFIFKLFVSCFLFFVFSLFMTHIRSTPIWDSIPVLKYAQFPWRFLSVAIFFSSILGGLIISLLKEKWSKYLSVFIIFITVILNWQYFKPERFFAVNDKEMLSEELWENQQKGAILDYLPKTALEPKEPAPKLPIVREGLALVSNFNKKSNKWSFDVSVSKKAYIEVPVFDFPNWQVFVDDKKYSHDNKNAIGRIGINLASGEHEVKGVFKNTPIRTFSNLTTLLSLAMFLLVVKNVKFKKLFL